jgi:hypothetical protein
MNAVLAWFLTSFLLIHIFLAITFVSARRPMLLGFPVLGITLVFVSGSYLKANISWEHPGESALTLFVVTLLHIGVAILAALTSKQMKDGTEGKEQTGRKD